MRGERELSAIDQHAFTNPTLLVEVTSRSTEDYDRGEKLSHYKQCPSLRAVLYMSHQRREVTVVARSGSGWTEHIYRPGEQITLADPDLALSVNELYEGIQLDKA